MYIAKILKSIHTLLFPFLFLVSPTSRPHCASIGICGIAYYPGKQGHINSRLRSTEGSGRRMLLSGGARQLQFTTKDNHHNLFSTFKRDDG
jgi:hypothetical protein